MPRNSTPDSTQHQQCSSSELFDHKDTANLYSKGKGNNKLEMKESNTKEKNLNNLENEHETAINLSGTARIESEVHSTDDENQLKTNILGKRKSPFSLNAGEPGYQKVERIHSPQTTGDNYGPKIDNVENQSASVDMSNDVICLSDRDKGVLYSYGTISTDR
ncbi:DgyrCDS12477 [Dimorphilus gyrociliatus]|uniref:DgyrCDS12477 n=1 Tax=Dimorphilus gyrociliatus TaxID=2664684 RepID=A0A7I8W7H0_9ANNE|nr:DgyrCDS12477 [Dimorphilus gyrociliatus]